MTLEQQNTQLAETCFFITKQRDKYKTALLEILAGKYRYYAQFDDNGVETPSYFEFIESLLGQNIEALGENK